MGLNILRIYLDACIVIYLVEEHQIFAPKIEKYLASVSDMEFYISDLTEMECLVMPLRTKNKVLLEKFQNWFDTVTIFSHDKETFHDAAQPRADFSSLKMPDALHLATALHHNCDEFWTNDTRLDRIAPNLVKNIL